MAVKDATGREIHVGDRVRVLDNFAGQRLTGKDGTVVQIDGVNIDVNHNWDIGVKFDEYMGGHNLDGACSSGHGRWGYGSEVVIIDESAHEIEIKFQFEDIFG